jgi:hypothetical protein
MSCEECERLSRAEIEATRQAANAEADLQAYYPEPPFGVQSIVTEYEIWAQANSSVIDTALKTANSVT